MVGVTTGFDSYVEVGGHRKSPLDRTLIDRPDEGTMVLFVESGGGPIVIRRRERWLVAESRIASSVRVRPLVSMFRCRQKRRT